MTIFLPQSRIAVRNIRSVSVNGRSADVTNSTRSDRGTKSVVRRSCSRMIALVPGVSTMWTSRSSSGGAILRRGAEFRERVTQSRQQLARLRELSLGGRFEYPQVG